MIGCTDQALRDAIAAGGTIAFDCGPAPPPIQLVAELVVSAPEVVLVGDGITLDARGASRVIHATASSRNLTLSGISIVNGATSESGAGIFLEAGALLVIDGTFANNHGPAVDPFLGGGAIAGAVGTRITVYRSVFSSNSAASGGAIQAPGDLTVIDSTFENNAATGTGGPMGTGGLGGAIAAVGIAANRFCGTTIRGSTAGGLGGGYCRISTDGSGSDRWEQSWLDSNRADGGGGMYVQNIAIELDRVAVTNNTAGTTGGIWYVGATGPFVAEQIVVAENTATAGLGAGLSVGGVPGSIAFSTIARNHASCPSCFSAAIDGNGPTLTASIVDGNTAGEASSPVSCRLPLVEGGGNLQWPVARAGGGSDDPGALCSPSARVVDPRLGPLELRTGPGGTYPTASPGAGSPAIAVAAGCPALDLIGVPRPTPCAAGAVEP